MDYRKVYKPNFVELAKSEYGAFLRSMFELTGRLPSELIHKDIWELIFDATVLSEETSLSQEIKARQARLLRELKYARKSSKNYYRVSR